MLALAYGSVGAYMFDLLGSLEVDFYYEDCLFDKPSDISFCCRGPFLASS